MQHRCSYFWLRSTRATYASKLLLYQRHPRTTYSFRYKSRLLTSSFFWFLVFGNYFVPEVSFFFFCVVYPSSTRSYSPPSSPSSSQLVSLNRPSALLSHDTVCFSGRRVESIDNFGVRISLSPARRKNERSRRRCSGRERGVYESGSRDRKKDKAQGVGSEEEWQTRGGGGGGVTLVLRA